MESTRNVKIYVIVDYDRFTKEQIWKELIEEKYSHKFYFGNQKDQPINTDKMEEADEVWTFGDCTMISDYIMAKEDHKEIWIMG